MYVKGGRAVIYNNVLVIGMSGGFVRLGKIFSCVIVVAIENMDIDWMTNQHRELGISLTSQKWQHVISLM